MLSSDAKVRLQPKAKARELRWPDGSALGPRGNQRCGFSVGLSGEEADAGFPDGGALDFSGPVNFAGSVGFVDFREGARRASMIFVVASLLTLQLRSQMRHCASVYWQPQLHDSALNL